jgi:hypothetical protein
MRGIVLSLMNMNLIRIVLESYDQYVLHILNHSNSLLLDSSFTPPEFLKQHYSYKGTDHSDRRHYRNS